MRSQFVDYWDETASYARVGYWKSDRIVNVWRIDALRGTMADPIADLVNVASWRGLRHSNVTDFEILSPSEASEGIAEGLRRARREHANYLRRTVSARRDGAADGTAAASWAEITEENAVDTLAALDSGEFWDYWEFDHSESQWARADSADDTEKFDAYVAEFDQALAAGIERVASYWAQDGGPLEGKAVKVQGYSGVAFYVDSHYVKSDRVRAHMIGDDREFRFDADEIEPLKGSEFCWDCGQIGCTWHTEE